MKFLSCFILMLSLSFFSAFAEELKSNLEANKKDVLGVNPIKMTTASISRGRKLYVSSCVSCHGDRGTGDGLAAANLHQKPANLIKLSSQLNDGDFAFKISNGHEKIIPLNGMFGKHQIWDMVNYIKWLEQKNYKKND